jgi:hypothetical protein
VLGCTGDAEADETTVDESEATLHAVDVGDASSAAHAGAGAAAPRFNISAFNGFKLSNLSAALDARCQAAVADVLDRDASGERPPKLYADPLEGARVAPLNGTDDVRFVYFIGVGNRPHALRRAVARDVRPIGPFPGQRSRTSPGPRLRGRALDHAWRRDRSAWLWNSGQ